MLKPRPSHVSVLLGVTLQRTNISSRSGGSGNTAKHASCKGNLDELWPFRPLACVRHCLNPKYSQSNTPLILSRQSLISLDY